MKRLFALIATFSLCLSLAAQTISISKALTRAQELRATRSMRSSSTGKYSAPAIRKPVLAYTSEKGGRPLFYVFNYPDGGFAIIGGDETARQVLGYSEEGSFNFDSIPDAMRFMLDCYEEQILTTLQKDDQPVPKRIRKVNSSRVSIGAMLTTQWSQNYPFNISIPIMPYSNNPARFMVGCVAVAMAQVMKYYNYPVHGTGSKSYTRTYSTYNMDCTFSADFENTYYDWGNMTDTYTNNSTEAEKEAVGMLMYHAGVSVDMRYGTGASGAYSDDAIKAMKTYFGYDSEMKEVSRSKYPSSDEWEDLIYNELQAGRPIIYSGNVSFSQGHTFLCDGYDAATGNFHINWGWAGYCDGYFPLTGTLALTPDGTGTSGGSAGASYTLMQYAIIGIKPNSSVTLVSDITLSTTSVTLKEGETTTLTATVSPSNATNRNVSWTSANPEVATVNPEGVITAIAEGKTTITCLALDGSGKKAICEVTVTATGKPDTPDEPDNPNEPDNPVDLIVNPDGTITYNGLRYALDPKTKEAKIIQPLKGHYTGVITIPESIRYEGTSYAVTCIGNSAFRECEFSTFTIPNSVTTIEELAFFKCTSLTSISLPNSITRIEKQAFDFCTGLTSITIPNSVTRIEDQTFYSCSRLTSVTIPSSVTSIGNSAFYECKGLLSLTIPNSVTSIEKFAFFRCYGLTSISLSNSVTTIEESTFWGCSSLTSIIIPNSVISIGNEAFCECSGLTSITIPGSLKSIGKRAFEGCRNVKELIYAEGCTSLVCAKLFKTLTSVTIPNTVTHIDDYAFEGCGKLSSITIPNSVVNIGKYAFYGCSNLTSIPIPNSVTTIGSRAFYDCWGLTSITIPSTVTTIGSGAFASCDSIASVHIQDLEAWCRIKFEGNSANPLSYAKHLYLDDQEITDLVIPNTITSIEDYAFCEGIFTSVTIPNSVTRIGEWVFNKCSGFTSITIPNSVTSIGTFAFNQCKSLTSVTISNSVTSIEMSTFCGCSGLTSLTIPNSVTTIGESAFMDCTGLSSITFSNSLTDIDGWAFAYCRSLPSITLPNSVKSMGQGAFYDCSSLTSFTLPGSITEIGMRVFEKCSNMTDLYCHAQTPPTMNNFMFDETHPELMTLHVPASSIDAYKNQDPWNTFGNIVSLSEEEVKVTGIAQDQAIALRIQDGTIHIINAPIGSIIYVYDTKGQVMGKQKVVSKSESLTLPQDAIYIIKVSEKTFKVNL